METVKCPICGGTARYSYGWTKGYSCYLCPECLARHTQPLPTEGYLTEFYQGFMYRLPDEASIKQQIRDRKHELRGYIGAANSGRFLDFGGGTGVASLAADELGFNVDFFDLDTKATTYVNERSKGRIRVFNSPDDLPKGNYDIIFCDNVIEHVINPPEFVETLSSLLKPQGVLVIKTPNASNLEALFKIRVSLLNYLRTFIKSNGFASIPHFVTNFPWALDPPRHLYAFKATSLEVMATRIGLKIVRHGFYTNNFFHNTFLPDVLRLIRRREIVTRRFLALLPISLVDSLIRLIGYTLAKAYPASRSGIFICLSKDESRSPHQAP